MMTYDLLFVALMILLLGPVFLVRCDDDGGQDQLSTTVSDSRSSSTSNSQLGPDSAMHNSSLNYDPSKYLSLRMLNSSGIARSQQNLKGVGPCKTASDCTFIGAICSDKEKDCCCPIGESAVKAPDEFDMRCRKKDCPRADPCIEESEVCGEDGHCKCKSGFVPDKQNIECVKAPITTTTTTAMPLSVVSTAETGNSSKSVDPKQEKESSSFPWYWFLVIAIVVLLLCGGLVAVLIFCGLCVSCGLGGGGGGGGNSRRSRGTPRSGRANSKKKGKSSPKGSKIQTSKSPRSKAPSSKAKLSKAKLSKAKTSKVKNSKASKF